MYATGGEPCCAECVTPVFNEAWSSRGSAKHPNPSLLAPCKEEAEEKGEGEEKGTVEEKKEEVVTIPPTTLQISCPVS